MHCTPELTAFLAARDRANAALTAQAETLAKLKALDAPAPQRRPTLIGVAPSTPSKPSAPAIAAGLTPRPNGRRSGVER